MKNTEYLKPCPNALFDDGTCEHRMCNVFHRKEMSEAEREEVEKLKNQKNK